MGSRAGRPTGTGTHDVLLIREQTHLLQRTRERPSKRRLFSEQRQQLQERRKGKKMCPSAVSAATRNDRAHRTPARPHALPTESQCDGLPFPLETQRLKKTQKAPGDRPGSSGQAPTRCW